MHFHKKKISLLLNDTLFCKRPVLIYLHARELFMFLFSSADFLQNKVFKNKPPRTTIRESVIQFESRSRRSFCWSSSGFKMFAKGYWQTTKLSTGMQRVITGKYFSVQYIVSYRDIHAYVYHKYSDTLNTFNMLCPLNKAKVIFKGSS